MEGWAGQCQEIRVWGLHSPWLSGVLPTGPPQVLGSCSWARCWQDVRVTG